jgi:tRNA A-37 threonylcarbamoyl transferase component Bud32
MQELQSVAQSCPSEDLLARFAAGDCSAAEATTLEQHATLCPTCAELMSELAGIDQAEEQSQHVGRFEIIDTLGAGAMGVVYLARDPALKRRVAVKVLREEISSTDEESRKKLLYEARTMAQLSHPNVITVYEVGFHEGQFFLAMEYVDGLTINDWLRDRARPWQDVVRVFCDVGRGLAAAHAAGLVHRDLKPENLLFGKDGRVRVTDFGLARQVTGAYDENDDSVNLGNQASLTTTGFMVGTPAYMAPEQWVGEPITAAADQFALAITFYEALCGSRPYPGENMAQLREAVLFGEPAAPREELGLPPELFSVIRKALSVEPENRFASMDDLVTAVEDIVSPRGRVDCPYVGLSAYQERDTGLFFGRDGELRATLAKLEDSPFLAVVGPSGVGKSSFVRAGLVPRLKEIDDRWTALVIRPGKEPLSQLVRLVQHANPVMAEQAEERLLADPTYFGRCMARHAHLRNSRILLFVDQLEELYVLNEKLEERVAFTNALMSVTESNGLLAVVVSMRSDLLDRVSENREFLGTLSQGLVFLPPLDRVGLEEALTQPAAAQGFQFESSDLVVEILDDLEGTPGALPLLQFAGQKLWQQRDTGQKLLTRASYEAIGTISGALAVHADAVVSALSREDRDLLRALMQRLVTASGTRALATVDELEQSSSSPERVRRLIDDLVNARLLVFRQSDEEDGRFVEIVHESLIREWPTLARWLDEDKEESKLLAELRTAAKQWESRDYPQGLLWRGEALGHARRLLKRRVAPLPPRERKFIDDAHHLATRSARKRRFILGGITGMLALFLMITTAGLIKIGQAEKRAVSEAEAAKDAKDRAQLEAKKAQAAESDAKRALEQAQAKEKARLAAVKREAAANQEVAARDEQLAEQNEQLKELLGRANEERASAKKAESEARKAEKKAKAAKAEAEQLRKKAERARAKAEAKLKKLQQTRTKSLN